MFTSNDTSRAVAPKSPMKKTWAAIDASRVNHRAGTRAERRGRYPPASTPNTAAPSHTAAPTVHATPPPA
jgi:hypothetical protein